MTAKAEIEAIHNRLSDLINDELIRLQDHTLDVRDQAILRLGSGMHVSGWKLSFQDDAWHVFAADGEGIVSGKDLLQLVIKVGEMP